MVLQQPELNTDGFTRDMCRFPPKSQAPNCSAKHVAFAPEGTLRIADYIRLYFFEWVVR